MGKIRDRSLAEWGRREIQLAEVEMPGLMALRQEYQSKQPLAGLCISGSLHMTIQTAVLIETLAALGAKVRWCSCNIFSTQDHAAAAVEVAGTAEVFAWQGETLAEYWQCTRNALTWPDRAGPDLIVDDGADATGMIHLGVELEQAWQQTQKLPELPTDTNTEHYHLVNTLRETLTQQPTRWTEMSQVIRGVSEETTTGVHRLLRLAKQNHLLFPVINVNDSVTKTKFDNLYGCRHSLCDGIMRATDVMIAGKKAVVCGYGDVGKGSAESLRAAGATVYITEIDPICALQALMEGFQVVTLADVVDQMDIFVTATGNRDVICYSHLAKMKHHAIVCNIGHFDNEIEVDQLISNPEVTRVNIKPQVDLFKFPDGHAIILLAEGRLVNLGCATGHPSYVMSCSFTNQVLAQLCLWENRETYQKQVYQLPKHLDERVARLHLDHLGAKLTELTPVQAEYLKIPVEGPYKNENYKY